MPKEILNQSNVISGEQNTNHIPMTSSITMMGLSLPFSLSTFLISGSEMILTNTIAQIKITERQWSGINSSGITAIIEVKVPGAFGKYPAPKKVDTRYSFLSSSFLKKSLLKSAFIMIYFSSHSFNRVFISVGDSSGVS